MKEGKKVLKPFATKLDEKILEKLDEISRKTQIPKSRLCRQAIELLSAHYERVEQNLELGERVRTQESFAALSAAKD